MISTSIRPKLRARVHGIFSKGIPYEIRNKSGDWSKYFGQWEGQKKDWFDTNSCWAYAGNEVLEDQLEFLMKERLFSRDDLNWFYANGYIDDDGDFYLSRRFIPILSGVGQNGNDESEFWRLTKKYGAIPSAMLPFTTPEAYFRLEDITQEMYELGREFKKRVNIKYEELGKRFTRRDVDRIKGALFQSELQIGVPVPQYSSWNQTKIKWDGNKVAAHSVALYKYDEKADYDYPYFIYDQYIPALKQLSRDYYIPIITIAVVTPANPVAVINLEQETLGAKIWKAIMHWFQQLDA